MTQKSGLGRGLGALLPGGEDAPAENGVTLVSVDSVSPNPRQPRSLKRSEELHELTESVREHGVLQPLIVTHGDSSAAVIVTSSSPASTRWLARAR